MADFWTEEREDQLIQLFEEQPSLYDCSSKTYSNRINKNNALRSISSVLGVSDKEVSKKIHSLRTQYNRYAKLASSGSAGGKTARQDWILRRLSFLEPHIKKRASLSNMDDKDDEAEKENKEAEKENKETEEGLEDVEEQEEEERSEPGVRDSTQLNVPPARKKKRGDIEKQEADVLSAVGSYFRNRSQQKPEDEITLFCRNLEQKMRRIRDENILLELEHQLEEACYHATMRDRSNQTSPSHTYPPCYPPSYQPFPYAPQ